MSTKPATINEYLEALSDEKRRALERLRKIIQAAAPGAEECIGYNLPAFRLHGKGLIWFGAGANHCAIYGVSETRKGEFKDYDTSGRGTLRFQAHNPLPAALVRRLVKARIAKVARTSRAKVKRRVTARPRRQPPAGISRGLPNLNLCASS
ncbi:MAG: iron chaperone [Bryobacteraceae bacterium]